MTPIPMMRSRSQRRALLNRLDRCQRKIWHESWEGARLAGLAVWLENPRATDANPATPYPCDAIEPLHYHCGHLRFGPR